MVVRNGSLCSMDGRGVYRSMGWDSQYFSPFHRLYLIAST